jgi:hypothetical protein
MLPMTRTTTPDASEGCSASVDLVITLEAPKISPTSPTLEGDTTLEAFVLKRSRWLVAEATAPTHLHPAILVTKSVNSNEAAAGLQWRLHIMAHNIGVAIISKSKDFFPNRPSISRTS